MLCIILTHVIVAVHLPALLQKKSPIALLGELLVGFDPVDHLVGLLRTRFGQLAEFCVGGLEQKQIGIKWRPHAFYPGPLRVPTAHCMLPLLVSSPDAVSAGGNASTAAHEGGNKHLAVVDAASVLNDMVLMGEGLICDISIPDSNALL